MDAILLVGGYGTRLHPLTKTRPKPMIPLANTPFVERTVNWLHEAGVDHIILSLHHNAEQFMSYFSQLKLDVDISYAVEGTPLGTGGAIKNCEPFLRSSRVFVFNGDIFTNLDIKCMLKAHKRENAVASLALSEVEDPSRFGVIETDDDGRIRSFVEKPPREEAVSHDINAGIYIFEREVFDHIPNNPCSIERDVFPKMLAGDMPMHGYREWPYWTDLGTPIDYLQAHRDILSRKVSIPLCGKEISPGIWMDEQVHVSDSALIRSPLIIGRGAEIAAGATVGPAVVLGPRSVVGENALIEDSVLWEGAIIRPNCIVRGSILGRCTDISGIAQDQVCEDYGRINYTRKAA